MSQKQPPNHLLAPPNFTFTFDPTLAEFNVPAAQYLATHLSPKLDGISTGVVVFRPVCSSPKFNHKEEEQKKEEKKPLLVQRAPHDSMPLKCEVPGGAVDLENDTILHGAARELWEEAELVVRRFVRRIREGEESSLPAKCRFAVGSPAAASRMQNVGPAMIGLVCR
jgi:8-oxo-dGTP pyrophosphatase MutT (NUDIX family)